MCFFSIFVRVELQNTEIISSLCSFFFFCATKNSFGERKFQCCCQRQEVWHNLTHCLKWKAKRNVNNYFKIRSWPEEVDRRSNILSLRRRRSRALKSRKFVWTEKYCSETNHEQPLRPQWVVCMCAFQWQLVPMVTYYVPLWSLGSKKNWSLPLINWQLSNSWN